MAQNNVTMSVVDSSLKDLYPDGIENCQPEEGKFFSMADKKQNFHGRRFELPLQLSNNHGISASFAKSQANRGNNEYQKFDIPRKTYYGAAYIENEVFAAGREDIGNIIDQVTRTTEGLKDEWMRANAKHAFGDGTGALSTIGATTVLGSPTLVLASSYDTAFFSIGMVVQFADPSGPTIRNSGGELIVTGVNREAGTVTLSGNISTVTGTQLADLVLRSGDLSVVPTGVSGWIQGSGASALHGMTRTADPLKQAGLKVDAFGKTYSDALTDGIAQQGTQGAKKGAALFINPYDCAVFLKQLDSKVARYEAGQVSTKGLATASFSAIKYLSTRGAVDVIEDHNVKVGEAWLLHMSDWEFKSAGKAPMFMNLLTGSSVFTMRPDLDAQEIRIGAYGNWICYNPANHIKFYNLAP